MQELSYYNKTLHLIQLNKRIQRLQDKLCSLDSITTSSTSPQRGGRKGDSLGAIVAKREEYTVEIREIEKERETLIGDVKRALYACCDLDHNTSFEALRRVISVVIENKTASHVGALYGKTPESVNNLVIKYLGRMKEREEKGISKISTWL